MSDHHDIESAIETLRTLQPTIPVAQRFVAHAIEHLDHRLENTLRERPRIETEQAAMAVIRSVAGELVAAADALAAAAHTLKEDGKGFKASQAHQASQRARHAALELVGA